MNELYSLLNRQRFQLHNEKALQRDIEQVFINNQIIYRREYHLSNESIIDFLVGSTGVEVKINSSAKLIYKQCERYLGFEAVRGLLLITNKIIKLPAKINNKPTIILNLGIAWL